MRQSRRAIPVEIVERTPNVPAAVLSQFPPNVLGYLAVLPSHCTKTAALRTIGLTPRAREEWLYKKLWSQAIREAEGSVQGYAEALARASDSVHPARTEADDCQTFTENTATR